MNKKFFKYFGLGKKIAMIAIAGIFLLSSGIMFLTSYSTWSDYFKLKSEQKELFYKSQEPEVTTMNGISVSLKEGMGYYDNGRANPVKSDFVVNGLYTIGNEVQQRDYEEELGAADYKLTVPEDFAQNGGELTFNYRLTEVVKDENGEPVKEDDGNGNLVDKINVIYDFTEVIDYTLTPVKLDHVEVVRNPYIVAYAEGDVFNVDGMEVNVVYNDGSKNKINAGLLEYSNEGLKEGAESVSLKYRYGDGSDEFIEGSVPVTVTKKSEFTNGTLEKLVIPESVPLLVGENVKNAKYNVYGQYSSGNYVKLDATKYTVNAYNGAAEFGKTYSVELTSKENSSVKLRFNLYSAYNVSAKDATLDGCTEADGYVTGIDGGDSVEFNYNAPAATVVDLYLNVSNGNIVKVNGKYITEGTELGEAAYLKYNGYTKVLSYSFAGSGPYATEAEAVKATQRIYIGTYYVKQGKNVIKLCFKNGATSASDKFLLGSVKSLEVTARAEAATFGGSIENLSNAGLALDIKASTEINWCHFSMPDSVGWTHAAATDGRYFFFYSKNSQSNAIGDGNKVGSIVKYDPQSKAFVAYTSFFGLDAEAYVTLFVRDGYVYTRKSSSGTRTNNTTFMRVPTTFTGKGTAVPEEVPSLNFTEGSTNLNTSINSAYYSQALKKYVLLANGAVKITDDNGSVTKSFNVDATMATKNVSNGAATAKLRGLTADDKYIYVYYKVDGCANPSTKIYDWNGTLVYTLDASFSNLDNIDTSVNLQSQIAYNGSLYCLLISWGSAGGTKLYKLTPFEEFSSSTANVEEKICISLVEYLAACEEKGVTPGYINSMVGGAKIPDLTTGPHGICTDGRYYYVVNSRNAEIWVDKVDIQTLKVVATTKKLATTAWTNEGYLFYKDGTLYLVDHVGELYELKTSEFITNAEFKKSSLKFNGFNETLHAISYDPTSDRFVIMTNENTVWAVDGKTMNATKIYTFGGRNKTGVFCDDGNIYLFYEQNSSNTTAYFDIIDWSGNVVKKPCTIPQLTGATAKNNVQGMFTLNGEYYFLVCQHGDGGNGFSAGTYIVNVKVDVSVLA